MRTPPFAAYYRANIHIIQTHRYLYSRGPAPPPRAPYSPVPNTDDEEHASRLLEEMSVSGAAAAGGGLGITITNNNATLGSTSTAVGGGALSPPLSPMYSSPKGVSPRTNILPSFAWGKIMLKHLKRRPPGAGGAGVSAAMRAHGAATAMHSGASGGGVGGGALGGWAGGGVGGLGVGVCGGGGAVEGDGGFVYPAGMVQVPMHFEAFTFVLTAGCWPLQSVSSSFKPPAPIEDYVVSFLDFYGEVCFCSCVVCL